MPFKEKKVKSLRFRCSDTDAARLKSYANLYARQNPKDQSGNFSAWMVYAGLNAPRKFLYKATKPKKKKPPKSI